MPIYVLVRFNLLLLTCYQRAMVDNYDTLRGYGIPCEQNFFSKKCKFGVDFWIHVVIQCGQSRMTRTERRKATAPILKMLSVEHVWIAWWKNSEHRTLRTRLVTDSRLSGKTTERTGRKIILTMDTQRATICTVNDLDGG